MNPFAVTCLLAALLAGSPLSAVSAQTDEASLLLERMNTAMSQMTYQGTFVYVQGDDIESMRITHVADERGVRERLIALSGAQREVLRDSGGVRWVLADDHSVFADPGFNRSFFPELPVEQRAQMENSYTLRIGGEDRIAGHEARNLEVLASDRYRYGYSLWIEKDSDLLLKWELIGDDQKPIARLMFTDIRMGSEVDARELKPNSQLKKFKTVESSLPSGRGLSQSRPRWQPGFLPPGFRMTAHRFFGEQDQGIYEHLVYGDGLAAVSVYIESVAPDNQPETGANRMGTTHAFSRQSDNMLITVVGDVPAITVKVIGASVEITGH